MNAGGTGFNTCKECHKTESLWNHTTTGHKEGEQLEDRRNVGERSCNFGDGTDQRVQSLMFMTMYCICTVARKVSISFVMSACRPVRVKQLVSRWIDFCYILYWEMFLHFFWENASWVNIGQNNRPFTCHLVLLLEATTLGKNVANIFAQDCTITSRGLVEEWKTNLMSLAILFHLLCAQHVSDINISIIRSLRLCCCITASVALFSVRCVLELWCGWFWVVLVLQAEALHLAKRTTPKTSHTKAPTHNELRTRRPML